MSGIIGAVNAAGNTAQILRHIYPQHADALRAIETKFREAEAMISQPEWQQEEGFKLFLIKFGCAVAESDQLTREQGVSLGNFLMMALGAVSQECDRRQVRVHFSKAGAQFE
jgi:hypothetical protein